jgi:hypothetical protein
MEADKTPKTPAGVDMRNEVIDAFLSGNAQAKVPAPMWKRKSVIETGAATVCDVLEDQLSFDNLAAMAQVLALAAKSEDKLLKLTAHALIARMAAYHAWMQEEEPEPEISDSVRAILRGMGFSQ